MPAVHVLVLGAVINWPDRIGAEIEFHRLSTPDRVDTVRRTTAGAPFAVAAHDGGIAPALRLVQALLPTDRPTHLFLSGRPDSAVTPPATTPPIPVTYLATAGVPAALSGWRPLAVRLVCPADPVPTAICAIREQPVTLDPGDHVWSKRPQ
ncbi:hypothetical protein [Actinophytocola sp.]|uniref:hypothetical protein n=1 Tax=Actinophytocola sp. TaxID=1872138 RepID=UPI002ED2D2AE